MNKQASLITKILDSKKKSARELCRQLNFWVLNSLLKQKVNVKVFTPKRKKMGITYLRLELLAEHALVLDTLTTHSDFVFRSPDGFLCIPRSACLLIIGWLLV